MPPDPVYKGGGRRPAAKEGRAIGGVQLGFPILVGLPFQIQEGERGKERERERERGATLPPLVQFGLPMGGRHPLWAALSLPYGPCRPINFPGRFR